MWFQNTPFFTNQTSLCSPRRDQLTDGRDAKSKPLLPHHHTMKSPKRGDGGGVDASWRACKILADRHYDQCTYKEPYENHNVGWGGCTLALIKELIPCPCGWVCGRWCVWGGETKERGGWGQGGVQWLIITQKATQGGEAAQHK